MRVELHKQIDASYDILIEPGLFEHIPNHLKRDPIGNKYAIITDSNVRRLYGDKLLSGLTGEGIDAHLIDFSAGEESKNLNTLGSLASQLVNNGFDRKSAVIALGGGVVGDMAGLVAATYMRGIDYIQVPTTLLAQVDSSVGGKTAVDLPEGKNLFGAFYQPKAVYIDPTVLLTLPERRLRTGMAEVIKYGVIYDRDFFEYLENNVEKIKRLDSEALTHIIYRSCEIKADVVQKDPREENFRSILNYGHTLGHAEEVCRGYNILHGEAVAIGTHFAGTLAVERKFWQEDELKRQTHLINSFDLPLKSEFDPKELIKTMYHDKKAERGRIMFVLPESIGKMVAIDGKYRIPVSEKELMSVLSSLA